MKTSRRTLLTAAALAAFTPRLSEAQPTQEKPMTTHTYHDAILHYRDNGKTDAPALLLLHGGLGTAADDFAPLLPHLLPVSLPNLFLLLPPPSRKLPPQICRWLMQSLPMRPKCRLPLTAIMPPA